MKVRAGLKKMRAGVGVKWYFGCSSRNTKAVKNNMSARIAYFLLDSFVYFSYQEEK